MAFQSLIIFVTLLIGLCSPSPTQVWTSSGREGGGGYSSGVWSGSSGSCSGCGSGRETQTVWIQSGSGRESRGSWGQTGGWSGSSGSYGGYSGSGGFGSSGGYGGYSGGSGSGRESRGSWGRPANYGGHRGSGREGGGWNNDYSDIWP